jgi:hypothetical protein
MKLKWLLLLLASFITSFAEAGIIKQFPFQDCTIELLDSAGASEATSHSDAYSKALTPFDLQIRTGKPSDVFEKDYLALAAANALTWNDDDQTKLQKSFEEIALFLKENDIHLNLPKTIQLLKTAGAEEFGADGYTRENRIMLCVKGGQEITTHVVAHELFHVFSRFNSSTRDKVYAIFGFEKCNRINTAAAMENRVITNPDCPFIEHFIPLVINGAKHDFVLQLYSIKPFETHFGLENANVALLEVSGSNKDKHPLMKDGKGVLSQLQEVPELLGKISKNTPYVLHPEEISAEHFSMWIIGQNVPQPEYLDKMKAVLATAKN